jgi:hypothetical protein
MPFIAMPASIESSTDPCEAWQSDRDCGNPQDSSHATAREDAGSNITNANPANTRFIFIFASMLRHNAFVAQLSEHVLKVWTNTGAPLFMCITPGPNQIIWITDGAVGRFAKFDLSGNALGAFAKEAKMAGQFDWTHGVACSDENRLYAAEELNFRVQKLEVQAEH